jgi:hypothetical protein
VYVRFGSPQSSAPSTDSIVIAPVTELGLAAAGVTTLGPAFVTTTDAVPTAPPHDALTVAVPALLPQE